MPNALLFRQTRNTETLVFKTSLGLSLDIDVHDVRFGLNLGLGLVNMYKTVSDSESKIQNLESKLGPIGQKPLWKAQLRCQNVKDLEVIKILWGVGHS